jgi:hypothetical protein
MQKLVFKIPTSWNSLSNNQLIKISLLLFSKQDTKLIDYKLFKVFVNYKWFKFKLLKKIILLFKVRQVSEIKKHFNFFYKKQDLTRFIPAVKINSKKYFAPADRLTNFTIGEFSVCEDLYLGYLRNANNKEANFGESYLQYLFAVLYINSKNKVRPIFNKDLLEEMVAKTEAVKTKYLYAALLSYKGCRDAISSNKKYKHIFPKPKEATKQIIQIPQSSGFSDVILSFSNKVFGDYHKTFKTNLYTFLDGYEMALSNLPKDQK